MLKGLGKGIIGENIREAKRKGLSERDAVLAATSDGPVHMGGTMSKALGLFKRKAKDIELPNESGEIDSRLPRTDEAVKEAFRNANEYAAGQGSPTERLRAAGRKAAARRK